MTAKQQGLDTSFARESHLTRLLAAANDEIVRLNTIIDQLNTEKTRGLWEEVLF